MKDCDDPNPLIRALAVRTMGCIRVDKITEYLCEPLRKCLKDEDPYVRKTAAVCVAKLHDIDPPLVEEQVILGGSFFFCFFRIKGLMLMCRRKGLFFYSQGEVEKKTQV